VVFAESRTLAASLRLARAVAGVLRRALPAWLARSPDATIRSSPLSTDPPDALAVPDRYITPQFFSSNFVRACDARSPAPFPLLGRLPPGLLLVDAPGLSGHSRKLESIAEKAYSMKGCIDKVVDSLCLITIAYCSFERTGAPPSASPVALVRSLPRRSARGERVLPVLVDALNALRSDKNAVVLHLSDLSHGMQAVIDRLEAQNAEFSAIREVIDGLTRHVEVVEEQRRRQTEAIRRNSQIVQLPSASTFGSAAKDSAHRGNKMPSNFGHAGCNEPLAVGQCVRIFGLHIRNFNGCYGQVISTSPCKRAAVLLLGQSRPVKMLLVNLLCVTQSEYDDAARFLATHDFAPGPCSEACFQLMGFDGFDRRAAARNTDSSVRMPLSSLGLPDAALGCLPLVNDEALFAVAGGVAPSDIGQCDFDLSFAAHRLPESYGPAAHCFLTGLRKMSLGPSRGMRSWTSSLRAANARSASSSSPIE
jgi:hypothetical protein